MKAVFYVGLEVQRTESRGSGLFLTEATAAGIRVLTFGGAGLTRAQYEAFDDFEHCLQIGPDRFLGPSGDLDDFTNHSCEPSTRVEVDSDGRANLWTVRDLRPGDEITFDYSSVQVLDSRFRIESCRCGARSCRRRIGDFTRLEASEQERFRREGLCPSYVLDALLRVSPSE
jgi:hypothetical protein